ncbi:MAG: MATE family efflux transporter [Clostridiales bacterium]|jgi:putative MATE family efflux protein|nr:MATE family efflux transporter [Clostridiales bacterium]
MRKTSDENMRRQDPELARAQHVEEEIHRRNASTSDKMGNVPIGKLLAQMSGPAIASMTINALYNIVDSIFVAMVSQKALTAVSFIMPLQMLMIALFVGSGVGVNSLIARRLGARNYKAADQAASTSIRIAVINALIFLAVGLFLIRPFMSSYTNDSVTWKYGVEYGSIVLCFSMFSSIDMMIEKVLQSTGNMIAPMTISMSGALVNIVLDPILIFGLLGAPKLGVAGAALATVIGQFVAMMMAWIVFFRKDRDVRIRIRGFHIDWAVVKDIYDVGLPSIIMQSIGSFMLLGYNQILSSVPTAVAVLGAYFKLQSFVFMPVFGLNQGAMPIMGYNFGARNRKRLMRTYIRGIETAVVIMAAGFLIFQLFPDQLLRLFSADHAMLQMGVPALRRISICFIPAAFGIMSSTLFQGVGYGVYSLIVSVVRQLVCILPFAYILFHTLGVTASWFSFPLAEGAGFLCSLLMVMHLYKKEIKTLDQPLGAE